MDPILGRLRRGRPAADEEDGDADQDTTEDLEPREWLRQEDHRKNRCDERLEVHGERGLCRADLVYRAEPENVRQHERAEGGEEKERPDLPTERPVLLGGLRKPAD